MQRRDNLLPRRDVPLRHILNLHFFVVVFLARSRLHVRFVLDLDGRGAFFHDALRQPRFALIFFVVIFFLRGGRRWRFTRARLGFLTALAAATATTTTTTLLPSL